MMGFDLPKGMLSYYLDCQSKISYLADVFKKKTKHCYLSFNTQKYHFVIPIISVIGDVNCFLKFDADTSKHYYKTHKIRVSPFENTVLYINRKVCGVQNTAIGQTKRLQQTY